MPHCHSSEYLLLTRPLIEYPVETKSILSLLHHRIVVAQSRPAGTRPEAAVDSDIIGEKRGMGRAEEGLRLAERLLRLL